MSLPVYNSPMGRKLTSVTHQHVPDKLWINDTHLNLIPS